MSKFKNPTVFKSKDQLAQETGEKLNNKFLDFAFEIIEEQLINALNAEFEHNLKIVAPKKLEKATIELKQAETEFEDGKKKREEQRREFFNDKYTPIQKERSQQEIISASVDATKRLEEFKRGLELAKANVDTASDYHSEFTRLWNEFKEDKEILKASPEILRNNRTVFISNAILWLDDKSLENSNDIKTSHERFLRYLETRIKNPNGIKSEIFSQQFFVNRAEKLEQDSKTVLSNVTLQTKLKSLRLIASYAGRCEEEAKISAENKNNGYSVLSHEEVRYKRHSSEKALEDLRTSPVPTTQQPAIITSTVSVDRMKLRFSPAKPTTPKQNSPVTTPTKLPGTNSGTTNTVPPTPSEAKKEQERADFTANRNAAFDALRNANNARYTKAIVEETTAKNVPIKTTEPKTVVTPDALKKIPSEEEIINVTLQERPKRENKAVTPVVVIEEETIAETLTIQNHPAAKVIEDKKPITEEKVWEKTQRRATGSQYLIKSLNETGTITGVNYGEKTPTLVRNSLTAQLGQNNSGLDRLTSAFHVNLSFKEQQRNMLPHILAEKCEGNLLKTSQIKNPNTSDKIEMEANAKKFNAPYSRKNLKTHVEELIASRKIVFDELKKHQDKSPSEALNAAAHSLVNNPAAKAGLTSVITQKVEEGVYISAEGKLPLSVKIAVEAEIKNRRGFAVETGAARSL